MNFGNNSRQKLLAEGLYLNSTRQPKHQQCQRKTDAGLGGLPKPPQIVSQVVAFAFDNGCDRTSYVGKDETTHRPATRGVRGASCDCPAGPRATIGEPLAITKPRVMRAMYNIINQ